MAHQSEANGDEIAEQDAVTDVDEARSAVDDAADDGAVDDAADDSAVDDDVVDPASQEAAEAEAEADAADPAEPAEQEPAEAEAGADADAAEADEAAEPAEQASDAGDDAASEPESADTDATESDADGIAEDADAKAEAAARRKAERRDAASKGSAKSKGATTSTATKRRTETPRERRSRAEQERRRQRSGNPAKRGTPTKQPLRPPTAGDWFRALRVRTLPMSIAPVAVGAAAAYNLEGFHLGIALLCLGVALFLQLGVNVANDYADGVRGTDRDRVGPKRITTSTSVDPKTVRTVAIVLLAIGAASGVALAIVSQRWWLLAVGAVCVLLAWFYTGGKRPYGYYGLGEIVAFAIFGPVAVLGTMYATLGRWSEDGLVLSLAMGCFAAALMLVNNLRDIDTDRAAGKRTVPSVIGRVASKVLYALLILAPYGVLAIYALAFAYGPFVMLTLVVALPAVVIVAMGRTPRDYITALGLTGLTTLLYGLGVAVSFWAGVTGFAL